MTRLRTMRTRRHPRLVRCRLDERGQALVEFALVVPLLLLLLLGVVEFARAWNTYQVITDAAREAARTAVVANPLVDIDSVNTVIDNALERAGLNSASATKTVTGFRSGMGTPATIGIDYPFQFRWIASLLSWSGADASIELRTSVVMRNE
jgi:Flp pilus assembly protein TadG